MKENKYKLESRYPEVMTVVEEISDNMDVIKTEIMKNKSLLLDSIIESSIVYV